MPGYRQCDHCGATYPALRSTSRYCGDTCRQRARRAAQRADAGPLVPGPVWDATRAELAAAGLLDTALGQAALVLALHIDSTTPATARALAALCKAHREVLTDVLRTAPPRTDDPVTRLRSRVRDRRTAALGPAPD
jgi:hypothetical protein